MLIDLAAITSEEAVVEDLAIYIVMISIALGVGYVSYLKERSKKEAWKQFAASHNLTFVAGSYPFSNARVYGHYRGHRLELSAFHQNRQIYTHLSLYPNILNHKKTPAKQAKLTTQAISKMLDPKGLVRSTFIKVNPYTGSFTYQQTGIMTDTQSLVRFADLLSDTADHYQDVLVLESEAIPALQAIADERDHRLQTIAMQLLKDISQRTSRFSHQLDRFLCPHCLTCFGKHEIQLPWWQSISYYGCRTCGQSPEVIPSDSWVVAVLDNQTTVTRLDRDKLVRVNWLARRSLFDFDEVEIVQATDEEVERFAVQVGNDTDPVRKPRYEQMRCHISAGCHLSENTQRILQRLFGEVEVEQGSGGAGVQGSKGAEEQGGHVGVEASAGDDQDDIELDLSLLSRK